MPASESDDYAYSFVDPGWAPPQPPAQPELLRPGPRWLPPLVLIMITSLVAIGLFAAERVGSPAAAAGALAYLPGDGQVAYQRRETAVGSQSTLTRLVTESARLSGGKLIGGLDWTLGAAVGRAVGFDQLDRVRFWRTTTTEIDALGSSQQLVRVYRVDASAELIAESGPGSTEVYNPALVELPASARPGDSWQQEGTVGGRRYRSDLRASAAEPGCLRITGTIAEQTSAGRPGPTRTVAKTWCLARGVVTESIVRGDVTTTVVEAAQPAADPTLRTVPEPFDWSEPAIWRRRDYDLISTDAGLGSGPMAGAPGQAGSVVAASGLLIRTSGSDDLTATTAKSIDRWISLWRMHPGGTVMSVAAFGDVIVTTTSRREAVAYSDAGVRLWSIRLDDVAFWAPSRLDAGRIAIADASGAVRVVETLTGRQVWQQRVSAQVSGPVVADPKTVVVMDGGGQVVAFDAGDGNRRWSTDGSSATGAILGDTVVINSGATLEALDLTTGRYRWLLPTTGTLDALVSFGDTVVAATQLGTQVIDIDGTVVARLPAYELVSVVGDTMVGWGRTEAEFRYRDYSLLHTIDTPDRTLSSTVAAPLAYRHGVLAFGHNWAFSTWSDEP